MTPCGRFVRRHLVEALGIAEVPSSPRIIFRTADENQLRLASRWRAMAVVRANAHRHHARLRRRKVRGQRHFSYARIHRRRDRSLQRHDRGTLGMTGSVRPHSRSPKPSLSASSPSTCRCVKFARSAPVPRGRPRTTLTSTWSIVNQESLDRTILSRLNEAFEESNLPMRVDVVDWHAISDSFREVIQRDYAVLRSRRLRKDRWEAGARVALGEVATVRSGFAFKSRPLDRRR